MFFTDLRERAWDREREEHQSVASSTCSQLGIEPTTQLGMCPDPESNPRPFGAQDDAPTN